MTTTTIERWKADRVFIDNEPDRIVLSVADWGGENIADFGPYAGPFENWSRAKLAAAAPELLAALKALLDYANRYSDSQAEIGHGAEQLGEHADSMSVAGIARAAIARAEGR